jgi:capsule polysaccharide export protein KpsE/RkpR
MEKTQVDILKKRIEELKNNSKLSYPSNVLFPFSKLPDVAISYYRAFREVEIQTKIMEFVLPMYEQALVEEQKSVPNLLVVDKAVPPQLKDSPKKAFIILAAFFLGFFVHLIFVFRGESAVNLSVKGNVMEEKEANFFNWVKRFYRIKL